MRASLVAGLLMAMLLAGCSGQAPPSPSPAPPAELMQHFDYRVTDDRGDWYMHLRLRAVEETHCSSLLTATGTSAADGPDYLVGGLSPNGMSLLGSGRTGWGQVHQGETTVTLDGGSSYQSGFLSDEPGAGVRLDAGEEGLLFWAARAVASDGYNPFPFRALLDCNHPVELVERAAATTFLLFDERTFPTAVAPLNTVSYAKGDLAWTPSSDRTLFVFDHYGAEQATIDLTGNDVDGHWDASGYSHVQDSRQGFMGRATLHLEQTTPPLNKDLRGPWMEGLFVNPEAVARFPHEGDDADRTWTWDLQPAGPGGSALTVDATATEPTVCAFAIQAAGTRPMDRMSNAFALWGASPTRLDWFSESGYFYKVRADPVGQEVTDDAEQGYARDGDGLSFQLAAGTSHLAWPFSGPSHATVTLTCAQPVQMGVALSVASDLPNDLAYRGAQAVAVVYGAGAGTLDVPLAGNLTLVAGAGLDTYHVEHAGGAFDILPGTALQAYDVVGPMTLTHTGMAQPVAFSAILGRA